MEALTCVEALAYVEEALACVEEALAYVEEGSADQLATRLFAAVEVLALECLAWEELLSVEELAFVAFEVARH